MGGDDRFDVFEEDEPISRPCLGGYHEFCLGAVADCLCPCHGES